MNLTDLKCLQMYLESSKRLQEIRLNSYCLFFMYDQELKNEQFRVKVINVNNKKETFYRTITMEIVFFSEF